MRFLKIAYSRDEVDKASFRKTYVLDTHRRVLNVFGCWEQQVSVCCVKTIVHCTGLFVRYIHNTLRSRVRVCISDAHTQKLYSGVQHSLQEC